MSSRLAGDVFAMNIKHVGYALRAARVEVLGSIKDWIRRLDEDAVSLGKGYFGMHELSDPKGVGWIVYAMSRVKRNLVT